MGPKVLEVSIGASFVPAVPGHLHANSLSRDGSSMSDGIFQQNLRLITLSSGGSVFTAMNKI